MEDKNTNLRKLFNFTVHTDRKTDIIFWILSIIVLYFTGLFFGASSSGAIFVAILLLLLGILFGLLWSVVGKFLSKKIIINPLHGRLSRPNDRNIILSYLVGDDAEKSFIQFESKDIFVNSFKTIISSSIKILIPFLAIIFTILDIFADDTNDAYNYLIISVVLAFLLMALYLPITMIVEDSRIMIKRENGTIDLAGGKLKDILNGIFGITGVVSGYKLFSENTGIANNIFLYVFIVIFLLIISAPILYPALFVYYRFHEDIVNNVRQSTLQQNDNIGSTGIYPKRTNVIDLTPDELIAVSIKGEISVSEIKGLRGKFLKFSGKNTKTKTYSDEDIIGFESNGGWICARCKEVNSNLSQKKCSYCLKKQKKLKLKNTNK